MDVDYEIISNRRVRNEVRAFMGERLISRGSLTLMDGSPYSTEDIILTNVVKEPDMSKYTTSVYLRLLDNEKTSKEIKITYPSEYPFRPPKVYIGDTEYFSLLGDLSRQCMWKFIPGNKWNNKKCLHCNTIMCRGNWGPCMNSFEVCKEIRYNILVVRNALKTVLLRMLINKFLKGIYVPVDTFLFDEEFTGVLSPFWGEIITGCTKPNHSV